MRISAVSYVNFASKQTVAQNSPESLFKNTAKIGDLPCAYCSTPMISRRQKDGILYQLMQARGSSIINIVSLYEPNMSDVEKKVFREMKNYFFFHPEATMKNFFTQTKEEHLSKLIKKQKHLIYTLMKENNKVVGLLRKNIDAYLRNMLARIENRREDDSFRNNTFVYGMVEKIKECENVKDYENLIGLAKNMPCSVNDEDAFIVKYSRYETMEIIARFLGNSLMSIEHIKPKSHHGNNNVFNLLYVCAKCNNERSNESLDKFALKRPGIYDCLKNYIERLFTEFPSETVSLKKYIFGVKETLKRESKGRIDL